MNLESDIPDPSGYAVKLTVGELVGRMYLEKPLGIEPRVVLAELKSKKRLEIAFPGSEEPEADLVRRLHLMRGSTLIDNQGRKFQIRKRPSMAGFVFIPKFVNHPDAAPTTRPI